jgi:hypothetical protein
VRSNCIDIPKVDSIPSADEKRPSARISRSGILFMLIILLSMALMAVFANIQHFHRDKIETVIVKPANPR